LIWVEYCVTARWQGVVERIVDQLRLNPEAGRGIAVDRHIHQGCGALLIAADVGKLGQGSQLLQHLRRPCGELIDARVLQRVLELPARNTPADRDVLRGLQKQIGALDLGELRT
jgi:hypothetical protein